MGFQKAHATCLMLPNCQMAEPGLELDFAQLQTTSLGD